MFEKSIEVAVFGGCKVLLHRLEIVEEFLAIPLSLWKGSSCYTRIKVSSKFDEIRIPLSPPNS